jgi:MFS family permease
MLGLAAWRHLQRHPHPIISLAPLANAGFATTAVGAGALIRIPARAALFVLPLMFQAGFGLGAFAAGLLLIALNGGDLISKPWIKPAFDRFGFRSSVTFASLLGLAGIGIIALAGPGPAWLTLILVALVAAGLSRSAVFTGMASLTYTALHGRDMSSGNVLASISMQLFNALAITVSALVLGVMAQIRGSAEPDLIDYRLTLAILVVFGLAASLRLHDRMPRKLSDVYDDEPN